MIAAIVVPAGIRSIARMRACLVSGRIAVFEEEGASRVRDLDLLVDREVERAAAFSFDLGLVMGSSEVRATPSAAPPQPRRANHPAGRDPLGRLGRTQAWKGQNPAFRIMGSNPSLSAIDLGSRLSSAFDQPQNPQQTGAFQVNDRTGDYRRDGNLRLETTFFSKA